MIQTLKFDLYTAEINSSRFVFIGFIGEIANMGRPFYPTEAEDPDLDWLVSNFLYERPDYFPVETGSLPLMLIPYLEEESEDEITFQPEMVTDETTESEETS